MTGISDFSTARPTLGFDAIRTSMERVGVDSATSLRVISQVAEDMIGADRVVLKTDVAQQVRSDIQPVALASLLGFLSLDVYDVELKDGGTITFGLSFGGLIVCFDSAATGRLVEAIESKGGVVSLLAGVALGKEKAKFVTAALTALLAGIKVADSVSEFVGGKGFCINYFTSVITPRTD